MHAGAPQISEASNAESIAGSGDRSLYGVIGCVFAGGSPGISRPIAKLR